ncbi:DUF862-domain-containing protein [Dacryopinax primogenitus]|uniref:DUF862-domain-containing protein n=1 Tax=Dacryopinax primogenitus (strain DJM 731) TaxID=1858805 RepID=M5GEH2_DACPD|nr:DUF862-domain-containing protein [Dacryopinax primogenitus]EJU03248.1 DUF862-domain-containing protein [Dacryopinax primogenitus]
MSKVELYVYDLSSGMARSLSLQLTGRQIDGIWHTSVVVFGKEVFYGQGISVVSPGTSHHGRPLQILDMGLTHLDEGTFQEYIDELSSHYTADKYHLLEFNCNSFTNDVVGFLTGGSIPGFIKDLPADFLNTPLGAALRPTIDSMFRGPPTAPPTPGPSLPSGTSPSPSSSPLASLVSRPPPVPETATLTAPLQLATNPSSLRSLLNSHKAATVLFTAPATCAPCRVIDPFFSELAQLRTAEGLAYVKVDLDVGLGRAAAQEWGVSATPTVMCFLKGKKRGEVRGANVREIRTQVDLLICELYPPHPHTRQDLPAIQGISLSPILFSQIPKLDSALSKFLSFVNAASASEGDKKRYQFLFRQVLLLLEPQAKLPPAQLRSTLQAWSAATVDLAALLPEGELFPLADFWRLAVLSSPVAHALSGNIEGIKSLLSLAYYSGASTPRPYLLTTLRLCANLFAYPDLARLVFPSEGEKQDLVSFLVCTLLSDDAGIRTATASVTFNLGALHQQAVRQALEKHTRPPSEDWIIEVVSALIEALSRETSSEEVVHRLVASLALFVFRAPGWEELRELLQVLQAQEVLLDKLLPGGCGEIGVRQKSVQVLVKELAGLCA